MSFEQLKIFDVSICCLLQRRVKSGRGDLSVGAPLSKCKAIHVPPSKTKPW